jgi:NAD(P)H-hydrate repair Nnr-like enzyme with NAD(P)H-hydrate dehydratase domain
MDQHPYWKKQTPEKPLFPDIEWAKPEQKSQAGRLGVIGGNKLGFISVAESYETALKTGAGEVKILLPETLKRSIPSYITDVVYAPSNQSGGLSQEALNDMKAFGQWATGILLIGDAGKNSETAILYENFMHGYNGPLTITRDAIDLLKNSAQALVNRPDTVLITSFAQLQKIFQAVYYPKVLTFSMQLTNLVEALHKFTISYPVTVAVFHNNSILVANNGEVTSTTYNNPMRIWRGQTATNAATYWLWHQKNALQSVTTSLLKD